MERLKGYEKASVITEQERLPVGGYVLKILDAEELKNDYGKTLKISFDIAEGDFKDFFAKNYKQQTGEDKRWKGTYRLRVPKDDGSEQDEWTMRRFKTVMHNIEDSNPGYQWDWNEKTLKGKKIGALFNNKEYDFNGRHGFFTNCHSLVTVEKIESGNFKIPDDTLLKKNDNNGFPSGSAPDSDGFWNIPNGTIDEELPFN